MIFSYEASVKFSAQSESQYKSDSEKIAKAISPIRITKIRKNLIFKPVPYEAYLTMGQEFAESNNEGFDELPKPFFLETVIEPNYFPDFTEEFFEHFNYLNRKFAPKSSDWEGFVSVFSDNYHSLVYASYEITTAISKIWSKNASLKKLGYVTTIPSYYVNNEEPQFLKIALNLAII